MARHDKIHARGEGHTALTLTSDCDGTHLGAHTLPAAVVQNKTQTPFIFLP